jgi:hypothetical protein
MHHPGRELVSQRKTLHLGSAFSHFRAFIDTVLASKVWHLVQQRRDLESIGRILSIETLSTIQEWQTL